MLMKTYIKSCMRFHLLEQDKKKLFFFATRTKHMKIKNCPAIPKFFRTQSVYIIVLFYIKW